ncbi:hypothetical protein LINPERPRIM_LOCUS38207 [Linum perenne]
MSVIGVCLSVFILT